MKIKNRVLITLFSLLFSLSAHSQIFWTENFNNGCTTLCNAGSYNGVNGPWSMTNLGVPIACGVAVTPNEWFVSCAENGNAAGVGGTSCGAASGCGVASPSNASLHIGSIQQSPSASAFCTWGDCGAAYDSGGFCTLLGTGPSTETDKRAESPTIDCSGKVGITIDFNYMMGGELGVDYGFVEYSDNNGATWNFLASPNPSGMCGAQGKWAAYSFLLPNTCDNNPTVKIAFHWLNDDNGAGADPSFAVDDVTLSVPAASNTITTGVINPISICACSTINVPFTSTGTFVAGNIYKAQLSDASGSFALPTNIGTLSSSANAGVITCTIPCNTPQGTNYLIQVISSNPPVTGSNNGVNITINAPQDSTFFYSSSSYCQAGADPSATITGVAGGTFTSSPAGLVFLNATTGQIDVSASAVGIYFITYTTPGPCASTMTAQVEITGNAIATFSYIPSIYCANAADPLPTYSGGGFAGNFSATPVGLVFISAGTGQVDLSASTPGTYTVTNDIIGAGGCPSATFNSTITINAAQDSTFAYAGSTFCQSGTNPVPTISGTLGGTFTSSPAGLNFLNTTSGEIDLATSTLGTYSITYTTPGPCATSLTIPNIQITLAPVASFSYNPTTYCQNAADPSPTFSGGGSAGTFTATPAGLTFVSTTTGQVDLSASAPGTYTVTNTIAASGGCPLATAPATITINGTPNADFSYIGNPYCTTGLNPSPTFTNGGIAGTFTSTPAGLVMVASTGAVTLNLSTPGTYTVTNTITNVGCPNSVDTSQIVIVSSQTATFSYPGTPFCQSASNANPTITGTAGTFTATPAGLTINNTTGVVNLGTSTAGTYTVTNSIAATTSCPAVSATTTIVINASPNVTINSGTICSGTSFNLVAGGATSYTWSAGATSTGSNTATASPTLTSTFTVTGTTGTCSDTAIALVTVQVCIPPVAAFTATPLIICTSGCTTFTDASTNNPTTWLWQFPGGVPSSSTAQNPGSVCYSTIGQFTVILIVTNTTGADTLIMPNYISVVNPIPVFITGNTSVNTCETTDLTAMPAGTSYQWGTWLGSIECSTCQTATVTPLVSEQYWVHYTDVNGCTDDDTTMVTITAIYTYFMPTGFSPNSDNINDELVVHGRGVQYMNLKVFDRVGEKVFETSEWDSHEQKSSGWDGRLHGLLMNENTFVYELTVTFCNGQTQKENGSLLLVR